MKDLTLDRDLRRGDKGAKVKLVQEWLTLHDFAVVPDSDFGAATEAAVKSFQKDAGLPPNGVVGPKTFVALVSPMRFVMESIEPKRSLGATVVAAAKKHLSVHPREVGGENCGPWVRLYMGGNEGKAFAWCAGFVCYLLRQACEAHGQQLPIKPSVSCDSLAASAKVMGSFLDGAKSTSADITPGSFFLSRRTPDDWTHVGIVTGVAADTFATIEGNTNDAGSREGFEVCARTRGYDKKDFIRI